MLSKTELIFINIFNIQLITAKFYQMKSPTENLYTFIFCYTSSSQLEHFLLDLFTLLQIPIFSIPIFYSGEFSAKYRALMLNVAELWPNFAGRRKSNEGDDVASVLA